MSNTLPIRGSLKYLWGALAFSAALQTTTADAVIGSPATDAVLGVEAVTGTLHSLPQWSQLYARHLGQAAGPQGRVWSNAIDRLRSLDLNDAIVAVNQFVNRADYVTDQRRWSRDDFWATPIELLTGGGDCEDFAIAKYLLLREIGVSASNMRVLMIRGSAGDVDHAVLLVATSSGTVVLDNQRREPYRYTANMARSVAFAFNDSGMWLALGR